MTPIAIFIRHGDYHQLPDTPSAHQPFALNKDGHRQAAQCVPLLREMLHENDWQMHPLIHSSNLLRGWQTASIIAAGFEQVEKVQGFDALAERCLGSAANLSVSQIEKILDDDPRFEMPPPDWKSNSHYCLPLQGAESLMMAGERIAAHVQHSIDAIENDSDMILALLFVGHGAAFRHAAHKLGVLEFEEIKQLSMYHATPVAMQKQPDGSYQHIAGAWKQRDSQETLD
ncbi:MAG: histidine phosphatase family protein [Gammaproteobacteria bacterium]|nr:histidine phosphatase family protein [Gammaproteobacteria bacterium]